MIDVERADAPVSLNSSSTAVTTRVGDVLDVQWTATFSDGAKLDVAESSLVTFQSDNTTVATINNFGRITAVAAGSATVTMTYGTLSIQVPVVVAPKLAIDPPVSSIYTGTSQEMYADWAVPEGTDKSVQWSLSPGIGSISSEGVYTAPATVASYETVTVTATSVADPALSASGIIWVFPAVNVAVTPASATVAAGASQTFTAHVADFAGAGVTWNLSPVDFGSYVDGLEVVQGSPYGNPTLTYTAPASVATAQPVTLTATSAYDNRRSGSVTFQVIPKAAPPAFGVATGTYPTPKSVTLSTPTANAYIRYTLDGTVPNSTTGLVYTDPIPVSGALTIRAMAYGTNMADSAVSSASYRIVPTCTRGGVSGYSHRRAITVHHVSVPNTDQTNFPLLVSGTYPWLATVANGGGVQNGNGYDVLFTSDAAGTVVLDHEVESYSAVNGNLVAWVRVPSLSHSDDTTVYAWYGNPSVACSQENHTGVWDAGYQMVLHLAEMAEPYADSSSNGYLSTEGVHPTRVAGRIGPAQTFDGLTQYIGFIQAQSPNPSASITIEAWARSAATSTQLMSLVSKWDNDGRSTGHESFHLSMDFNATYNYWGYGWNLKCTNGNSCGQSHTGPAGAAQEWHHFVLTANSDGSISALYVDGQNTTTYPSPCQGASLLTTTSDRLTLGAGYLAYGGYFLKGLLDEVRISTATRSADWIYASWMNQSSPATFYSIGEDLGVPGPN